MFIDANDTVFRDVCTCVLADSSALRKTSLIHCCTGKRLTWTRGAAFFSALVWK